MRFFRVGRPETLKLSASEEEFLEYRRSKPRRKVNLEEKAEKPLPKAKTKEVKVAKKTSSQPRASDRRRSTGGERPHKSSTSVDSKSKNRKKEKQQDAFDAFPMIDRVPTALNYHSFDSAEELIEEKTSYSRYSIDKMKSRSQGFDELSDDNDDRYSQHGSETPGIERLWSDSTDSCPARWRSFDEGEKFDGRDDDSDLFVRLNDEAEAETAANGREAEDITINPIYDSGSVKNSKRKSKQSPKKISKKVSESPHDNQDVEDEAPQIPAVVSDTSSLTDPMGVLAASDKKAPKSKSDKKKEVEKSKPGETSKSPAKESDKPKPPTATRKKPSKTVVDPIEQERRDAEEEYQTYLKSPRSRRKPTQEEEPLMYTRSLITEDSDTVDSRRRSSKTKADKKPTQDKQKIKAEHKALSSSGKQKPSEKAPATSGKGHGVSKRKSTKESAPKRLSTLEKAQIDAEKKRTAITKAKTKMTAAAKTVEATPLELDEFSYKKPFAFEESQLAQCLRFYYCGTAANATETMIEVAKCYPDQDLDLIGNGVPDEILAERIKTERNHAISPNVEIVLEEAKQDPTKAARDKPKQPKANHYEALGLKEAPDLQPTCTPSMFVDVTDRQLKLDEDSEQMMHLAAVKKAAVKASREDMSITTIEIPLLQSATSETETVGDNTNEETPREESEPEEAPQRRREAPKLTIRTERVSKRRTKDKASKKQGKGLLGRIRKQK